MTAPLDAALNYAHKGWRTVPILPGTKRPSLTRWTDAATTNPDTIRDWWHTNPDHGVGIVTGPHSGIFVVDIDDLDALRDLEQQHQPLPDTLTSLTGSGGMHLIYRHPTGVTIRNDAGKRLGPGIDIRGDGGQIVAPPTIHPNGTPYTWDVGQPDHPVDPPQWLIDLVAGDPITEPARHERIAQIASDRPGDLFAAATTWTDILTPDGWTLHHVDRQGEHHWTRPGKNPREGTSATTGYKGSDVLKIFTSSVTNLGLVEGDTYTKLGYIAATRFNSDHAAAASFLAHQGWNEPTPELAELVETSIVTGATPEPVAHLINDTLDALNDPQPGDDHGWDFTDLTDHINGTYTPETPTLLTCTDGTTSLLYKGKVHSIAGEPGGGKTWLALVAVADTLHTGGTAVLIDYEDTPGTAINRLRQLGVTNTELARFRYINPPGPLVDRNGRMTPRTAATLNWLQDHTPNLIVVDSVGESIANEGADQNDDGEVATWNQLIPKRLKGYGSTILLIDHVTKNKETRGQYAIGSQRKLAAVDGAHYNLEVRTSPSRTADGHLRVTCGKDRHGTFQKGHAVCDVHVTNQPAGRVSVTLEAFNATEFKPTVLMERVSLYLEQFGDSTKKDVEKEVEGGTEKIRMAYRVLMDDGYITSYQDGRAHMLRLEAPYRQPAVTLSDILGHTTDSDIDGDATTFCEGEQSADSPPLNSPENTISPISPPTRPPVNTTSRPSPVGEHKPSRPLSPPPIGGEKGEKAAPTQPNWLA